MNSTAKIIIGALVVIVAGGALYMYSKSQPAGGQQMATTTASDANADVAGSVKPDTVLVGSENIQGKWQDNGDKKNVREFKADGTVVDTYDNETKTSGTYKLFTQANLGGVSVSFPLDTNAVYVQIKDTGSDAMTLNFRMGMSADANTLTLTYMDRGGVTTYTRI